MARDMGLLEPAEWGAYFDTALVASLLPLVSAACDAASGCRWKEGEEAVCGALRALDALCAPAQAGAGGGKGPADALCLCRAVLLTGRSALTLAACERGGVLRAAEDARSGAALCRGAQRAGAPGALLLLARALLREGLALGCLRGAQWRELARARLQEARAQAQGVQAELEDAELGADLLSSAPVGALLADFHLQRGALDAPLALACAAKALAHKAEGALAQLALGFVDGLPLELEGAALGEGWGGSAASGSSEGASRSSAEEEAKEGKKAGGAEGEAGQDGYRDAPSPVLDKFDAMECWLRGGSSSSSSSSGSGSAAAPGTASAFPLLVTRDYGEDVRGVHMRCDCEAECELMSVGEAYVLTVEKARAHPLCQALARGGVDRELSAAKHCYLALYLLCTRYDAACPFAAYYAILPRAFPSIPLFWTPREAAWLAGSHVAEQVEDRRRNILADYRLILECVPELAGAFSAEEFLWARMVVASRNFGITVDGVRTDALVPYADMLNHLRPRQTRWLYDSARRAFLIVSLQPLVAGQQVFDSYGKKCNSRFLLNYGFTVEHNADDDTGQFHNELRLVLGLPPPKADPWHWHKADRLGGGSTCVRWGHD